MLLLWLPHLEGLKRVHSSRPCRRIKQNRARRPRGIPPSAKQTQGLEMTLEYECRPPCQLKRFSFFIIPFYFTHASTSFRLTKFSSTFTMYHASKEKYYVKLFQYTINLFSLLSSSTYLCKSEFRKTNMSMQGRVQY